MFDPDLGTDAYAMGHLTVASATTPHPRGGRPQTWQMRDGRRRFRLRVQAIMCRMHATPLACPAPAPHPYLSGSRHRRPTSSARNGPGVISQWRIRSESDGLYMWGTALLRTIFAFASTTGSSTTDPRPSRTTHPRNSPPRTPVQSVGKEGLRARTPPPFRIRPFLQTPPGSRRFWSISHMYMCLAGKGG